MPQGISAATKQGARDAQPFPGPDPSYLLALPSTSTSLHPSQCPALQVASRHAFCRALGMGHLVLTEGPHSTKTPEPLGAPWRQPKPPPSLTQPCFCTLLAPARLMHGVAVAGISRSAWQDSPSWHPRCRQGGCQSSVPPSPAAAQQSRPSDQSSSSKPEMAAGDRRGSHPRCRDFKVLAGTCNAFSDGWGSSTPRHSTPLAVLRWVLMGHHKVLPCSLGSTAAFQPPQPLHSTRTFQHRTQDSQDCHS